MSPAQTLRMLLAAGLFIGLAVVFFLWRPAGSGSQQAHIMQRVHPDLLREWQWVKTYDPYDGGHMRVATEAEARFLEFRADGTLHERQDGVLREGYWRMDPEGEALALQAGAGAGPPRGNLRAWEYRHEIVRLTETELILAWQGRHGKVQEWYQAVSPAAADSR